MNNLPWSGCHIAFEYSGNEDKLWEKLDNDNPEFKLPEGWSLRETDGSGTCSVVIFEVKVLPTKEDGDIVNDILKQISGFNLPRNLVDVINLMLDIVPEEAAPLRLYLEATKTTLGFQPPEAMNFWWQQISSTLPFHIRPPFEYEWQKQIIATFMNKSVEEVTEMFSTKT